MPLGLGLDLYRDGLRQAQTHIVANMRRLTRCEPHLETKSENENYNKIVVAGKGLSVV